MKSISNRIYKGIFLVCLASILILVVTVLIANEALETTMLRPVPDDAPALQLTAAQKTDVFIWDGKTNKIAFIPSGVSTPSSLPALFTQLGEHVNAEIKFGEETFLVNVQHTLDGSLYWARNISAFETREEHLVASLFLIVGAIIIFSLVLAIASSRKIVRPLQQLSQQIGMLPVGKEMPPIGVDYRAQELHDIATTFNRFLDELNAYVEREQRLLNLASHELRTPIAVAAGALDVIESRGQLAANDRLTLRRIRTANNEMAENVQILLRLARTELDHDAIVSVNVNDCVTEILQDLRARFDVGRRIRVNGPNQVHVMVQPAMLKMLLRNVIQNSLQHTVGAIDVDIGPSEIIIRDQGAGRITLPRPALAEDLHSGQGLHIRTASTVRGETLNAGGLGLYIVTLLCERLGWSLTVHSDDGLGNSVRIGFNADRS